MKSADTKCNQYNAGAEGEGEGSLAAESYVHSENIENIDLSNRNIGDQGAGLSDCDSGVAGLCGRVAGSADAFRSRLQGNGGSLDQGGGHARSLTGGKRRFATGF